MTWLVAFALALAAPPDGATVYRENCTRCHAARNPSELDAARWPAVIFHMRTRAGLTRAEMLALEQFLAPPPAARPRVLDNVTIATTCAKCHDAQRIQAAVDARRDVAAWLLTLNRMTLYGAALPPVERDALAAWLAAQAP